MLCLSSWSGRSPLLINRFPQPIYTALCHLNPEYSILCIVGELAWRVCSCGCWQVKGETRHVMGSTLHMTHDPWHVTCDTGYVTHFFFLFFFLSFHFGIGATIHTRRDISVSWCGILIYNVIHPISTFPLHQLHEGLLVLLLYFICPQSLDCQDEISTYRTFTGGPRVGPEFTLRNYRN